MLGVTTTTDFRPGYKDLMNDPAASCEVSKT